MKKLLIGLTVCAAFIVSISPAAFAQGWEMTVCGEGYVEAMILHESSDRDDVPVEDCMLTVRDFDVYDPYCNLIDTNYTFEATAKGTQLNLALLKAQNWDGGERIGLCLTYDLNCGVCDLRVGSYECLGEWHRGDLCERGKH